MRLRCPHCRNAIEVVDETSISDISCPSCGSNFGFANEDKMSYGSSDSKTLGQFELLNHIDLSGYASELNSQLKKG